MRGHTITIESPTRTLPAGWYTDPAQSGGKRWWDGTKWTEHLKMPEKVAPASGTAVSTAHGVASGQQSGYLPTAGATVVSAEITGAGYRGSNWASWIALLLGIASLGLTFVTTLPGSPTVWVEGAGVAAVLFGLIAILRRMRGLSSIVWAPTVAILFGLGATTGALTGISPADLAVYATTGTLPTAPVTNSTSIAPVRPVSPEPFVFASKPTLTADGVAVQQIATAINRTYASGNAALAPGQSWPTSLRFTATQVLDASGTPLVTVEAGHTFNYKLSADLRSYTFKVSSGNLTDSAVYNSAADRFSFFCSPTDTACVPVK